MTACVNAEHASPVEAEFLWWSQDNRPYFYCAECLGWFLLGALYDEGVMPLGVDHLSAATGRAEATSPWFTEETYNSWGYNYYEDGEAA